MRQAISSLLFLFGIAALHAETPSALAIRNARIVTVSGPVLASGTVVIRNGVIEAVGANVTPPADAWVVEGQGLTVYPGLIDSLSTLGLPDMAVAATPAGRGGGRNAAPVAATPVVPIVPTAPPARGPEDRPATTSWYLAADQIQSTDRRIESARNGGFTTAATFPNKGIIAGQGALIELQGERPGQMVVQSPLGMYMTVQTAGFGSYPGSLMGVFAYIRQIELDTEHYRLAKQMYAKNPVGQHRPDYDKALEGMLAAPRVLLPATRGYEIVRMIRFTQDIKVNPVLYGVPGAYQVANELKKANIPVLVSLKWPAATGEVDPENIDQMRTLELREHAPETPAALAKANVKFAFYSDGLATTADIMKAVRKAISAGLSPADALRAMTLSAAEIYGVSDRIGSIDKGKIANLVITKGDIFEERSKVQYIIVDGMKYEPSPEAPATGFGAMPSAGGAH